MSDFSAVVRDRRHRFCDACVAGADQHTLAKWFFISQFLHVCPRTGQFGALELCELEPQLLQKTKLLRLPCTGSTASCTGKRASSVSILSEGNGPWCVGQTDRIYCMGASTRVRASARSVEHSVAASTCSAIATALSSINWRTEILQAPQGPPAQESTSTGPSEVCQWFRGELGESVVVRWDQNRALWHQLNSPCLEEEECCLWPQEHHPHRQTWRWKHYALGVFFC